MSKENQIRNVLTGLGLTALTLASTGCSGEMRDILFGIPDSRVELTKCRGNETRRQIRLELRDIGINPGRNDRLDLDVFDYLTCQYDGILSVEPARRNITVCGKSMPVRRLEEELRLQKYQASLTWRESRLAYERAACPKTA